MHMSHSKHVSQRIIKAIDESDDINKILEIIDEEKLYLYYDNVWRHIFSDIGCNILMYASKRGRSNICCGIVKINPACINYQTNRGYTALHYSAYYGHYDTTQVLIFNGADMFVKNNYHETAFDSALIAGYPQLHLDMLMHFLCPSPAATNIPTTTSLLQKLHRSNWEIMQREHVCMWTTNTPWDISGNVDIFSSWGRGGGRGGGGGGNPTATDTTSDATEVDYRLMMLARDMSCLFRYGDSMGGAGLGEGGQGGEVDFIRTCHMRRCSLLYSKQTNTAPLYSCMEDTAEPYGQTREGSRGHRIRAASTQAGEVLTTLADLAKYTLRVVGDMGEGSSGLIGKEYDCFAVSSEAHKVAGSTTSSPPLRRDLAITIGRSRSHDICLSDLSVSNHHARLQVIDNIGLFLSDLGSKHGTFVDGHRLYSITTSDALPRPLDTTGVCEPSPSSACPPIIRIRTAASMIRVGRITLSLVLKDAPDRTPELTQG